MIDARIAEDAKIPMVYLGPEPWDGLWRNRHHLMSRFARDRPVVYVEPPLYLKKLRRQVVTRAVPEGSWYRARMAHVQDNLYVCRTGALCLVSGRKMISRITWQNWWFAVNRLFGKHGIREYILWVSRPTWYPAIILLEPRMLIYHVVDEYSAYTTVTEEIRRDIVQTEEKILHKADLVIVVSHALLESKSKKTRSAYIVANGVDIDAYHESSARNQIPRSLADIPQPRIGYSGLIASRLDFDLLLKLADERPNYSIVLLGTVNELGCESIVQALWGRSNVYFLGTKPANEVPDYITGFDLCIIPYVRNERAANADPLKLYEYAAAGKVTICTDFPAAAKAGLFCTVAKSSREFISLIDKNVSQSTNHEIVAEAKAWATKNSWEARVRQISSLVTDHMLAEQKKAAGSQ